MICKIISTVLAACCLILSACNTVRGAAADIDSAANCTENAIKTGRCN